MVKLFVYGTLRDGCGNNPYLVHAKAKLLGEYTALNHQLRLISPENPVPIIEYIENDSQVVGEIWELDIPFYISELEQGYVLSKLKDASYDGETPLVYYPAFDVSKLPLAPMLGNVYNYLDIYNEFVAETNRKKV